MNRKRIIISHYISMMYAVLSKEKRKRKTWIKGIFKKRDELGFGTNLVRELLLQDHETFYNFARMTKLQFEHLLVLVGPYLAKKSIRKPINEQDRLLITIRFLATGMSYSSLSFDFRVGKSTIHNIIKETTEVIWLCLHEIYISKPNKEQIRQIARQFYIKTGMPNCFGAIDGKHCVIQAPPHSGTLYHNYKKTFSIVLLAVCDADYQFTYVNVGAYGSESDGGVLRRSEFGQALINNKLDLPEDEILPNTSLKFPYYLVGDEAFPLKPNLMRPYGGRSLTDDKEVFNHRLSSSRRYIENTFGIMVAKFRIFHTVISAFPELAKSIIKSAVVLHNFIRSTKPKKGATLDEIHPRSVLNLGGWRPINEGSSRFNNSTSQALYLRDELCNYINCSQQ